MCLGATNCNYSRALGPHGYETVAIQQEHTDWAKEQMLASWDKITETKGLARVKVDLP